MFESLYRRLLCTTAAIVLIAIAHVATADYDSVQFVLEEGAADGAALIHARGRQKVGAVRSSNDRLSDASFVAFARWRGLYGVYLWNTTITGVGFSKLETHPYLFQVTLIGPNVNDDGIRTVSRLPHVTHLQVGNGYDTTDCKCNVHPAIVTDQSLESLATMVNLKYLELENANITDEGIQRLASLKSVEAITFSRCSQLTLKGLMSLRLALPKARIEAFTPDLETKKNVKAIYHSDPEHLWNRMHEAFFVRQGPDGRVYGRDRLEPLLWSESKHLLEPQSHQKAMGLLTEFLANNGEQLINEPLPRAMMQRDLWLVFNWTEGARHGRFAGEALDEADAKEAVRRLRQALAAAIRRLELEPPAIQNLPDNYAAAVASGQFAKSFDPQQRERSFLPPDLFDPNGPWACIGRLDVRTAPQHLREENTFTNSVFTVFVRLPNGRAAIADYLKQLPAFPQGTQLALVRRAMLIESGHRVVASNLIESVQLRVIGATRADETFFEFRLSRPNLFAAKSGGLIASTKTDSDLKTGFLVHSFDPMESTNEAAGRPFPGAHVQPLLRCTTCHEPKRAEFQLARDLDRTPQNFPLAEMALPDVTQRTISWKTATPVWRELQQLLTTPDASQRN